MALEQSATFGVTTVMDMANLASTIAKLRQVSQARKDVSHILSACTGAMVEGGWLLQSLWPMVPRRKSAWPNAQLLTAGLTMSI